MDYRSKDQADAFTRGASLATKEFSNTIWAMMLFVLLPGACSEVPLEDFLKFNCNMDINNSLWKLKCTTQQMEMGLMNGLFYLKMQGIFDATSPITFHELLKSAPLSETKFLSCDKLPRNIIPTIDSILEKNCDDISEMIDESIYDFLNASMIKSININNVPYLEKLVIILNESSRLEKLSICNNYLPDLNLLRVQPNNLIQILVLEQNKLETIDEDALSQFQNLRSLDLSKNNVKHVKGNLLSDIPMIFKLNLSYNLIEEIDNNAFSKMNYMANLNLQNNKLKSINETLFSFNNSLIILDISNNDLKVLPPALFDKFSYLRKLHCSNCSLFKLDKSLFANCIKIEYITFYHNRIQFIPDKLFWNLDNLKTVNLGFNHIKQLNRNIFLKNLNLRLLDLSQNDVSLLTKGIFDGVHSLTTLNMSGNKIEALTDEHVYAFKNLKYLDLSRNKIQVVELGVMQKVYIHFLQLDDNLISKLKVKWKNFVYLEGLFMDKNRLTSLELPPYIQSTTNSITFKFRYNRITSVKLDTLIEDEIKLKTGNERTENSSFSHAKNVVYLSHNPLLCDCNIFPLYKYIKGPSTVHHLETFVNNDNLNCVDPQFQINKTLTSLNEDDFNCIFATGCPTPCMCGIRGKDNATFVNCSGSNLQYIPQNVPEETTVLYFNGNKLSSMQTLNIRVWNNLRELHLDNNSLTGLNDWNFASSLRYLSVRDNNITTIPTSLMHFIKNQTYFQLYFGGNNKICTCDRKELRNFIIEYSQFIGDVENIVCEVINNGTTAFLQLSSVPDSELCPVAQKKKLFISLCIFFSILIIILLTYYKQRQIILSFFYIHCDQLFRLCCLEDENDEDKIFDAFVAYSSKDRDIVMDILQELENHPPYFQLCIHERNWVPGRFICDNILSSVESSKRTIIVLSIDFITSPWFNLELRAAVSKMSERNISHVIIILAEKGVSLDNVEPEFRHLISKRTYLVWKERWFWEKLRYAMPRIKHIKENDTVILYSTNRSTSTLSLKPEQA